MVVGGWYTLSAQRRQGAPLLQLNTEVPRLKL